MSLSSQNASPGPSVSPPRRGQKASPNSGSKRASSPATPRMKKKTEAAQNDVVRSALCRPDAVGINPALQKDAKEKFRSVTNVFDNVKQKHRPPNTVPGISSPQLEQSVVPENDFDKLCDLIEGSRERHLFVRAPVGSGKSTMGALLAKYSSEEVFYINLNQDDMDSKVIQERLHDLVDARTDKEFATRITGKILIVDECHILFCHEKWLQRLIKDNINFFLLMFSSTSAHQFSSSVLTSSPVTVSNKCFMDLRFSRADIKTMVDLSGVPSSLLNLVQTTAVGEDEATAIVVDTLESLFSGHRLLTVYALQKLHACLQSGSKPPKPFARDAVIQLLHHHLRDDVFNPKALDSCRSAIINSGFPTLYKGQLICSQVLCDGQIDVTKDATANRYVSTLLTRGGLQPLSTESSVFSWTNPFVARFFEKFYDAILPRVYETDTISLVLLGLAWMDIGEYMKEGTDTYSTRFFLQMPFETQFQSGLMSGWKRECFEGVLEAKEEVEVSDDGNDWVCNRGKAAVKGRVDVQLKVGGEKESSFVELLVLGKAMSTPTTEAQQNANSANATTVEDHIAPFFTGVKSAKRGKISYTQALAQGKEVVVVIFAHIEMRAEAVKCAKHALDTRKDEQHVEKLKVLVLGMHSAFRYSVDVVRVRELKDGTREVAPTIEGKEELLANLNAKRILGDGTLVSNQRQPTTFEYLSSIQHPVALRPDEVDVPICDFLRTRVEENELVHISELASKRLTMTVWVRSDQFSASQVTPAENDVDSLKTAIRDKMGTDFTGNPARIQIFEWDATTNEPKTVAAEPEQSLRPTTAKAPYTFMIQSP